MWLNLDSKADLASPRKALGRVYGLAVRFGMPADGVAPLLVGEGIETVLSLVTAVPEITAAAALSAGSLG
ncbi:MAG: DNA primase, partial [Acidobacteria bacterium]|nr:DNA primase [Acidobacteriota bacterium]